MADFDRALEKRRQAIQHDNENLCRVAEVLCALASPEALRVMRRIAAGPVSLRRVAELERLELEEVERYADELEEVRLIAPHAKGWYHLSAAGKVAWAGVRPLL